MKTYTFLSLAACAAAWFACQEAKPTGAPAIKGSPAPAPVPFPQTPLPPLGPSGPEPANPDGDDAPDLTPNCDPDKDFNQLDFPTKIKDCLAKKKLYNFDKDECGEMDNALWKCDYATAKQTITDLGLSVGPLDKEQNAGGKIIGCGASSDGYTIVMQLFHKSKDAEEEDCTYTKQGKVVSVCFRKFLDTVPPVPSTDKEKLEYVAECLRQP